MIREYNDDTSIIGVFSLKKSISILDAFEKILLKKKKDFPYVQIYNLEEGDLGIIFRFEDRQLKLQIFRDDTITFSIIHGIEIVHHDIIADDKLYSIITILEDFCEGQGYSSTISP